MSTCRSCHAQIFWTETKNGRRAPFDPDGTTHFATCPDRDMWRKSVEPQTEMFDDTEAPPKPEGSRYPV